MVKIGMLIADRYEILEKIGTGGMADVYKAKDHKLNRLVAVKVLKQEFAENANFVSKFRMEAQAAGGLIHPNIVSVYDVGEELGLFYIVMELVDGITLKRYIEKKGRLSVREAVSIAIQVSMGLQAAHNNNVIHRDIKPQNIIISRDGKVKVTDFGIAKAATSNTITSNVMGSVHYTSPEQARGGYSDAKSDIYSLGITMFEMLTGRVPFNGDTTVAIAIKHIQEPMPSPCEYVPEIPRSVEQIVLKCCEKSPDRRYQNMGELIADLKESLLHPDDDFVQRVDPDTESATRMATPEERRALRRQYDAPAAGQGYPDTGAARSTGARSRDDQMRLERDERRRYQDDIDDEYDYDDDDRGSRQGRSRKRRGADRITTVIAVAAALIIGIIVIFLAGKAMGIWDGSDLPGGAAESTTDGKVTMPDDIIGQDIEKAQAELEALGLTVQITYQESERDSGTVLQADAAPGTELDAGATVVLTVAGSSEGIEVPDVKGKTRSEAIVMLKQQGFQVTVVEGTSDDVEEGTVISTSPAAGEKAAAGSMVTVTLSTGPDNDGKIEVPPITGLSEEDAMAKLTEAGLQLGNVMEVTNADAAMTGLIVTQTPAAGEFLEEGGSVNVEVSTGTGVHTYSYNGEIDAPTAAEDPYYQVGTPVAVIVVASDGSVLMNEIVTSFPAPVAWVGLASPSATVTLGYNDNIPEQKDAAGNVIQAATQEQKKLTRTLTFTPEN